MDSDPPVTFSPRWPTRPAHHDNRLRLAGRIYAADMTEAAGSAGGFLVPEEMARDIISGILEQSIMLARADVRPMQTGKLRIPGFDDSDHSAGLLYGGVQAGWCDEGSSPSTNSKPKSRQVVLEPRKLFILVELTSELLADAPNLDVQLSDVLIAAGSFFIDDAMLVSGTGAGKPASVIGSPGVITASRATAGRVMYSDLAGMVARLHPSCFPDAIWIVNPTVLPDLLQLTVRVENAAGDDYVGGSHVPVSNESNGTLKMLTREVVISEKALSLGSTGDIILLSPKQYAIGVRKTLSVERSAHAGFTTDTVWFRLICRLDGRGKWNCAGHNEERRDGRLGGGA